MGDDAKLDHGGLRQALTIDGDPGSRRPSPTVCQVPPSTMLVDAPAPPTAHRPRVPAPVVHVVTGSTLPAGGPGRRRPPLPYRCSPPRGRRGPGRRVDHRAVQQHSSRLASAEGWQERVDDPRPIVARVGAGIKDRGTALLERPAVGVGPRRATVCSARAVVRPRSRPASPAIARPGGRRRRRRAADAAAVGQTHLATTGSTRSSLFPRPPPPARPPPRAGRAPAGTRPPGRADRGFTIREDDSH